jgi:arsenite-transporting ATPase
VFWGAAAASAAAPIGIIERAASAAGLEVEIVKVENPASHPEFGCRATPAVVIGGKVVHSGGLPSREEVLSWLKPGLGRDFCDHPTRHLFFTGKGGVGKTSLSTAAALTLADAGKKVLLVSTDAASNLDEMLGIELRNTPTPVPGAPGLSVLNIDPDTPPSPIASASGADGRQCQRRPNGDGARAVVRRLHHRDRLVRRVRLLLSGDAEHYDHIVFDTAPTGHTLRC